MLFTSKTPKEILEQEESGVFNFQNMYSLYLYHKKFAYRQALSNPDNFVFPDGKPISTYLKTKQIRGPSFTKHFLENRLTLAQKHFFILPKMEDFNELVTKFPLLRNAKAYSPPYVQGMFFGEEEEAKILEQLREFKPDCVWVCIGNPKQEILGNNLYKKYKAFYFNVGAATDFVLGRKKESPAIFRKVGMEWFYRLITDFKYTKIKVWRSFIALRYLRKITIFK